MRGRGLPRGGACLEARLRAGQRTTLGSSLWRTMLAGRLLLASWCGCLRPARWPLMVLISLEGEL